LQKEKGRRAAEEKHIQEGSKLRKQREYNAELTKVKAQLIKRQSLEEMKAPAASCNVIVILPIRNRCADR
jgi:hypothetical protein